MLTFSSLGTSDVGTGAKAIARSARDLSLPNPGALLRHADVPGHLDAAMEAASGAVRGAIEQLPGQRRRRRRRSLLAAGLLVGALVGVLAVAGTAGWLVRRRTAAASSRAIVEDQPPEHAAPDGALPHPNGEVRELSVVGDLA